MQDFVVTVLRQQPDDLINHAVEYFNNLKAERDAELGITNEPESQNSQVKFATFADSPHDDDEEDDEVAVVNPKSDEQRTRLNAACNKVLLFNRLESEQFNTVLDAMFEFPAEPGQKIIAEGDDGDNFYVIENGVYDVYKNIDGE